MLGKLSGKTHEVITGVSIYFKGNQVDFSERTSVRFKVLNQNEISFYLDKGDAFDKAGSYGIQDWIGAIGIERIDGSYTNVMGLPTQKLQMEITKLLA
jgi:septum formation protein